MLLQSQKSSTIAGALAKAGLTSERFPNEPLPLPRGRPVYRADNTFLRSLIFRTRPKASLTPRWSELG